MEICTNGYRIEHRLTEIAPHLDLLRVSLEGVGSTNDGIRGQGSYQSALKSLGLARNIDEVLPLASILAKLGVRQLKLHHLRSVGNAADHPELLVTAPSAYGRLREELDDQQRAAVAEVIGGALDHNTFVAGGRYLGKPWLRDAEISAWHVLLASRRTYGTEDDRKRFLEAWGNA